MTVFIGRTVRDFAGKVFPVSWDAVLALQDLDAEFFLLVSNESSLCNRLENALLSFIRHQRLHIYVAKVSLVDDPTAATHLGTAYVPQVRFYRAGSEVGRHRGVATYETLCKLVGLPS